ncbi:hypothetical protein ARMGADRAFT_1023278 [Armillaria gallica]|uniref:Uncharacterized protein n=1 Tax=Armillaria gallica TaxID=47427 RepID=A0A2H3EG33_ARMGA|nr:hypothetical protein ARMGADRAFT_1023278 [Armillaria gallica]
MSAPIKYCDFVTPEPYTSALTPHSLTFEKYEALVIEQSTMEEKYDEAINKHKEWKMAKAKELKVEVLRQEKIEAERKVKDEQIWLEAEEVAQELKKREEAVEHKQIEDLEAKEKEKDRKRG